MPNVGELVATAKMRTAPFESGARKVRKGLKGMGDQARSTASILKTGLGNALAGLGGVAIAGLAAATAGVVLFGRQVQKQFGEIDRIAKLSKRTGFGTESIAALEVGASLSGASIATLSTGLQDFTKRLGEAQLGTGEALTALKELGLSADSLALMRPIDALGIVADRLKAVEGNAKRAALAADLFGRAGNREMMNFLLEGSEGLKTMEADAKRWGIALDAVDSAKIEAANDAITRASAAFEGFTKRAAVLVAPMVEFLGKTLEDFLVGIRALPRPAAQAFDALARAGLKAFDTLALGVKESMLQIVEVVAKQLQEVLRNFNATYTGLRAAIAAMSGGQIKLPKLPGFGALDAGLGGAARGARKAREALKLPEREFSFFTDLFDNVTERLFPAVGKPPGLGPGDFAEQQRDQIAKRGPVLGATRGNAEIERAIARSQFGGKGQMDEQKKQTQTLQDIAGQFGELLGYVAGVTVEQVTL